MNLDPAHNVIGARASIAPGEVTSRSPVRIACTRASASDRRSKRSRSRSSPAWWARGAACAGAIDGCSPSAAMSGAQAAQLIGRRRPRVDPQQLLRLRHRPLQTTVQLHAERPGEQLGRAIGRGHLAASLART